MILPTRLHLPLLISLFIAAYVACESSVMAQSSPGQYQSAKNNPWPEISQTAKPWTRWWWMGSAVDKDNLAELLTEYASAGLGGLEVAPIYGAKGFEHKFVDYLSDEWLELLHYTVDEAHEKGLGIDLTQGTGWPFGGPWVSPDHAAQRMGVQKYSWKNGQTDRPIRFEDRRAAQIQHHAAHIIASLPDGGTVDVTHTLRPDGSLAWDWDKDAEIWIVFLAQTGQLVKRAAPGGQGFTLDHFSKEAVSAYLGHYDQSFADKFPNIRALYNDSFEVYGSDFTASFFDYFKQKRGYDLKEYLPQLFNEQADDTSVRLKSDYRETISDMLLENFTKQWSDWAHKNGKVTKNQAHGSPGNLLDLYAAVDIPEGETFGSSYFPIPGLRRDSADIRNVDPDPLMLKFASSAAHLAGNTLVSSETFTWLGEHFKSSFSQAKPELEQAFLGGINHMFYHGVTYSPKEIDFPGWLFYASLNLNTHNSLWPHFRGFNDFIARSQSVLQAGTPSADALIYWPIFDVWADPKGLSKMITVHNIDEWLHPTPFYQESKKLMEKGYGLDFVSDALLNTLAVKENRIQLAGGAEVKTIVVPELTYMPLSTLERLIDLARQGATVVFQTKPQDVPGFKNIIENRKKLDELWQGLKFLQGVDGGSVAKVGKGQILLGNNIEAQLESSGNNREKLTDTGLRFVRRVSAEVTYYYLVNHTAEEIDTWIPLEFRGKTAEILDPQDGNFGLAESKVVGDDWLVRVQIPSGFSQVIQVGSSDAIEKKWAYRNEQVASLLLDGPWQISFGAGGPEKPDDTILEKVLPWTSFGDERNKNFSGTASYATNFTVDSDPNHVYILELGSLYESARVWLNGEEVGFVYSLPFQIDLSSKIKRGTNELKIEVANLMANRIRHMDQTGQEWRNYHEINFVNIDYKAFDASDWEVMPSGLKGPVRLTIYR